MGSAEFAPGNNASEFEQYAYSEQLFEPTSILAEFQRRQQVLGDFVTAEVGAYYLHQSIGAHIVKTQGFPREISHDNGIRRYFPQINYDPVPGDSDERRLVRLGVHIGPQGIEIPLLAVATLEEAERRRPTPPERSYVRGQMLLVHQALQERSNAVNPPRNLIDLFVSNDLTVQQQLKEQREYIGWLRAIAGYMEVPKRSVMRPYQPPAYDNPLN